MRFIYEITEFLWGWGWAQPQPQPQPLKLLKLLKLKNLDSKINYQKN